MMGQLVCCESEVSRVAGKPELQLPDLDTAETAQDEPVIALLRQYAQAQRQLGVAAAQAKSVSRTISLQRDVAAFWADHAEGAACLPEQPSTSTCGLISDSVRRQVGVSSTKSCQPGTHCTLSAGDRGHQQLPGPCQALDTGAQLPWQAPSSTSSAAFECSLRSCCRS